MTDKPNYEIVKCNSTVYVIRRPDENSIYNAGLYFHADDVNDIVFMLMELANNCKR